MQRTTVMFAGLGTSDQFGLRGLWVTNGTAAGTHELTGISGVFPKGLDPGDITPFNGEVLFEGRDASGNIGLWVTDGTATGTHELNIGGAYAGVAGLSPGFMTVFNGEVLFNGNDASNHRELWVTDGTA